MNCKDRISLRLFSLVLLILFLPAGQTFASGAELTNIVVKNDGEDLFIDLTIQGVFTNEMKKALLSGIGDEDDDDDDDDDDDKSWRRKWGHHHRRF